MLKSSKKSPKRFTKLLPNIEEYSRVFQVLQVFANYMIKGLLNLTKLVMLLGESLENHLNGASLNIIKSSQYFTLI